MRQVRLAFIGTADIETGGKRDVRLSDAGRSSRAGLLAGETSRPELLR